MIFMGRSEGLNCRSFFSRPIIFTSFDSADIAQAIFFQKKKKPGQHEATMPEWLPAATQMQQEVPPRGKKVGSRAAQLHDVLQDGLNNSL